jgi:hypothetical protein
MVEKCDGYAVCGRHLLLYTWICVVGMLSRNALLNLCRGVMKCDDMLWVFIVIE